MNFVLDTLIATGLRSGLKLDVRLVEYTDIIGQINDPKSALFGFEPDFVVYACFGAMLRSIVTDFSHGGATSLAQDAAAQMSQELDMISSAIAEIRPRSFWFKPFRTFFLLYLVTPIVGKCAVSDVR